MNKGLRHTDPGAKIVALQGMSGSLMNKGLRHTEPGAKVIALQGMSGSLMNKGLRLVGHAQPGQLLLYEWFPDE